MVYLLINALVMLEILKVISNSKHLSTCENIVIFKILMHFFQVDRHQCTYSDQTSFPCAGPDAKASFYKPTSVHR